VEIGDDLAALETGKEDGVGVTVCPRDGLSFVAIDVVITLYSTTS
jgi:hypothetical protein